MNKKLKIIKIFIVLTLSFAIGVNSVSAGMLFVEQRVPQEQTSQPQEENEKQTGGEETSLTNESSKQVELPDEAKENKNIEEFSEHTDTQSIENSTEEESAIVTIGQNGWNSTAETFNISAAISVPARKKGNILTIHLPRYIELAAEIQPGGDLLKVEVSGSVDDETGTMIVLTFKDVGDTTTVMGKDIKISQKKFIQESFDSSYKITAVYKNEAGTLIESTHDFAPSTIPNREIVGNMTVTANNGSIETTEILPLLDYDYEVMFTTGFKLNTETSKGFIIIDKNGMSDYYEWIGDSQYVQDDGTIKIPITSDLYSENGTQITYKLPIQIKDIKRLELLKKDIQLSFNIQLSLDNGRTSHAVKNFSNIYLSADSDYSGDKLSIPFDELISENFKSLGLDGYLFWSQGKKYFPDYKNYKYYVTELQKLVQSGRFKLKMKLPERIEWLGDTSAYNQVTREVSMTLNDETLKVFANYNSSELGFYLLIPVGYSYDFAGLNTTLDKYVFTDYKLAYEIDNTNMSVDLNSVAEKVLNVKKAYGQVIYNNIAAVFDGTENTWLFHFDIGSTLTSSSTPISIPRYLFEIDFQKTFKVDGIDKELSLNDVYDIKGIKLTPPKQRNGQPIIMNIEIVTDKGTKTYSDISSETTIQIDEGATIKSFKMQPKDEKVAVQTAGRLVFEGDVTVKDKDVFFKDNETIWFEAAEAVTEKVLSETEDSLLSMKIPPRTVTRVIKKFKKASLNKVLYSYVNVYPYGEVNLEDGGYIPFPSAEYGVKEVTWKLNDQFTSESQLKINQIKLSRNTVKKAVYTTNLSQDEITRENISDGLLNLSEGEYFNSLSLTLSGVSSIKFTMSPLAIPEKDTKIDSVNIFEVVETDKIQQSFLTFETVRLHSTVDVKYDASLGYVYGSQLLGDLNPGDKKTLPIQVSIYKNSSSSGIDTGDRRIYNPIFYLQIPDNFDYEGITLAGTMAGKQPKTVMLEQSDGKKVLKVEFYGDSDSNTGYYDNFENGDLKLNIKVSDFAKSGSVSNVNNPYNAIDLSNDMQKLKTRYPASIPSLSRTNITIYDMDSSQSKQLYNDYYYSRLSYNILQNLSLIAGAKVNSSSHIAETDDLSIRSGENFNVFINFYNNAGAPIDDFTMYIPVAQEGKANSTGDVWEWSAKLIQAGLDTTGIVTVSYSTNDNPTMNMLNGTADPSGMYVGNVGDISRVTMVKLSASNINNSTLLSLKAVVSNLNLKESMGEKAIQVQGLYSYKLAGSSNYNSSSTNMVTVRLTDTSLKGVLFVDENENGVMDGQEKRLSNKAITLYDKENNVIESVTSNSTGEYQFTVPSIKEGDYLKIDRIDGHVLTWQQKEGQNQRYVSYFDQETNMAIPTLKNAEYLNAGFIEAPEILVNPDSYTIRMGKTDTIQYRLSDGSKKEIKFESADETIAAVDGHGVITPVAEGTTKIKVYYLTASGITVASSATVEVESNNAPVITAPDTVTMNVNDLWDPLDVGIIEGLSLTDDHDKVTLKDLTVEDNVPVGGMFLFFFRTASTDRIEKAGTYSLKYSYTDKDGNTTEKTVKVKVNGQPYLTDLDEKKLTEDNMPDFFFRVGDSLDPYRDVKAYYEKASDTIGEKATAVEISKDDRTNGIFTLRQPVDNEGDPVAGSPSEAGKYKGTYYIKTASEAKSTAEIYLSRTLYAQGKIEFSGHNIVYPASSGVSQFNSWTDFYDQYKDELNLSAKLSTPKQDGTTIEKDILNTLKVIDSNTGNELDFRTLDFSLPEGQDSKILMLTLRVYDDGKAAWDSNRASVYGEAHKDIDLMITIQNFAGQAPHIHADDIHRVSTDEVRDTKSSSPQKNLISKEAIEEAKANNTNPLYERLMNDVTFEPGEAGVTIEDRELVSIKRASMNAQGTSKKEYDPNKIDDLYDMMTTIGTYKLRYRTKDSKNNQIFKERIVYVTGPTVFVNNMTDMQNPSSEINIVQNDKTYIPENVFSYHIDSDEQYIHWTTALPDRDSLSISNPGTYEIVYSTEHHYTMYPDGTTPRPNDTFKVTVKIHGEPQFNVEDNQTESLFTDEKASLSDVTASFKQAAKEVNGVAIDATASVSNDQNKDELTSNSAATIQVKFTADASSISKAENHKATLKRTYQFYGLPEMTVPSSKRVRADITQEELKTALAATASIAMPDGSTKNLDIAYDFTKMNEDTPSVNLKAVYTLANGNSRTVEKTVSLIKVEKPMLEADDIVYNVGDPLDILKDSKATGEYDGAPISSNDIQFHAAHIPVDASGKVNTPATYKVTLSYEDTTTGNKAEKDILVKVNGLPEFHDLPDLEKRVGDDIDILQKAYATWMKAPDHEGAATIERFNYADAASIGAKFELRDTKNEITEAPVDFSALNHPGYYSGEYYAVTPTGGEASERQTLLLHGKPELESASSLTLSINVSQPDDFLAAYRDQLGLKASVQRATKDKGIGVETVSLDNEIAISAEELAKITYGQQGSYPIEITVTDTMNVPDSKSNMISKTVTVNIVDVHGTPPTIATPASVQRVVGDDIGINNAGEGDIKTYLLNKASYTEVEGNRIITDGKKLISIRKVQGPQKNAFTQMKDPDNQILKALLNTVGEYDAVIEVTDEKSNRVQASMRIEVAGQTEFGYDDQDGQFVKMSEVLNVRQSENLYSYDGLYARHMDPSGEYDRVGVIKSADVDISAVDRHDLSIEAPHHYPYYDDDPSNPRGNDTHRFYLLVQGKIEVKNIGDIYARVGSEVNGIEGVTATYEAIDKDGKRSTNDADIQPVSEVFTAVGQYTMEIKATDSTSGAPNHIVTIQRNVLVWSVPNISYNEQFNVGKNATVTDLMNGLQAQMTYRDDKNQERFVNEGDIDISYEETLKEIQKNGTGKRYPITISVTYMDRGAEKVIEKTAYAYVLNDPATIIQIPKYLELKDDGTNQVTARAEVSLYKGTDKDESKESVPGISIMTDTEIELSKENASFKAYSYKKDNARYDGASPIIHLQYGKTESDHFFLKANKADIDEDNIGLYKGTLNFTMEYGGE